MFSLGGCTSRLYPVLYNNGRYVCAERFRGGRPVRGAGADTAAPRAPRRAPLPRTPGRHPAAPSAVSTIFLHSYHPFRS